MPSLKVHVLTNDEFDNLPISATRGSDITDSLGFANRFTNDAYVRYVAVPELQSYLVNHEIEELLASESTHEDENGIRHKKSPFFLPNLFFGGGDDDSNQAPAQPSGQNRALNSLVQNTQAQNNAVAKANRDFTLGRRDVLNTARGSAPSALGAFGVSGGTGVGGNVAGQLSNTIKKLRQSGFLRIPF